MKKFNLIPSILLAVAIAFPVSGWSQDYPKEPITFIVPWGPGGASDLAARAIAKVIPKYLGQQLVIVNKPGAGGAVGMESLTRSKPDGYTMFLASIGSNTLTPAFTPKIPFKYDEITFICRTQVNPAVLVVKADAPWKTLKDLVADIKNSMQNVGGIRFLKVIGVDPQKVTMIPFNSGNEQVIALLGGNIHFTYTNLIEPIAQVRGKKLRALAILPNRLAEFPDVPTFAEMGYPGVDVMGWRGVAGPPGLPEAIGNKWVQAMEKVCKDKEWIDIVEKLGDPGIWARRNSRPWW
ncbi:MAG: tripartite tricarboxylate transporter substrate binding protein [Deltaproteobacteria bacterium]|nr:tripartite tricarboxylate transporter substrate binding protein [Deltaproteobacteria bacterium]